MTYKFVYAPTDRIAFGTDSYGNAYGKRNNPKQTLAAKRFGMYFDGMTIQEALDIGIPEQQIAWDNIMRYILIKEKEHVD